MSRVIKRITRPVVDHQLLDAWLESDGVLLSDLSAGATQASVIEVVFWLFHVFHVDVQSQGFLSPGDVIVDVVSQLEGNLEEVAPGVRRGWVGLASATAVEGGLSIDCVVLVLRDQSLVRLKGDARKEMSVWKIICSSEHLQIEAEYRYWAAAAPSCQT